MAKTPNTEHKEAKTITRGTFVLAMALNTVLTLIVGVIIGYFVAINVQGTARAAVHQDIELVSKEVR